MTTDEKPTTAAPNNTTGQTESVVVPEKTDQPVSNTVADTATKPRDTPVEKPAEKQKPIEELWQIVKSQSHPEIWGVVLADPAAHVPSQIVLQKFLNAYDGDLTKAKETLTNTLKWRHENKPLELLKHAHAKAKFDGLGYGKEVFTWNIYGGVKDINETFGDLSEFISWRIALMELALEELDLASATKPITADYDPYKIYQVHDYKSISFFRQSPQVKSASTETIKVFAANYPELLKEKFFVNVPSIMGFMYGVMKLFVAAKTTKKFHPMSNSKTMVHEFGGSKVTDLGKQLPPDYGGEGQNLGAVGKQVHLE